MVLFIPVYAKCRLQRTSRSVTGSVYWIFWPAAESCSQSNKTSTETTLRHRPVVLNDIKKASVVVFHIFKVHFWGHWLLSRRKANVKNISSFSAGMWSNEQTSYIYIRVLLCQYWPMPCLINALYCWTWEQLKCEVTGIFYALLFTPLPLIVKTLTQVKLKWHIPLFVSCVFKMTC